MNLLNQLDFSLSWKCTESIEERIKGANMRIDKEGELDDGSEDGEICLEDKFFRDITDEEWNTVVHPQGPWAVIVDLSHGGFVEGPDCGWSNEEETTHYTPDGPDGCFEYQKTEHFAATATLRDFVYRLAQGPGHGFFYEGLMFERVKGGVHYYTMLTGT